MTRRRSGVGRAAVAEDGGSGDHCPNQLTGTDCSSSTTSVNHRGPPSMSRRVGYPWPEQMARKMLRNVEKTRSSSSQKRSEHAAHPCRGPGGQAGAWHGGSPWFKGTRGRGHPTPMTNLGGLCLELLSGKGLESAFLEGIGLKHKTVLCHHGAVFPKTPMETRTVPWLHRLRLPPRGHLPNGHNGEPSVLSRSRVRCVSFSPRKSGNKSNTPPASTVAGTGFAGHCNPSS